MQRCLLGLSPSNFDLSNSSQELDRINHKEDCGNQESSILFTYRQYYKHRHTCTIRNGIGIISTKLFNKIYVMALPRIACYDADSTSAVAGYPALSATPPQPRPLDHTRPCGCAHYSLNPTVRRVIRGIISMVDTRSYPARANADSMKHGVREWAPGVNTMCCNAHNAVKGGPAGMTHRV